MEKQNQLLTGSICLTDLIDQANAGHSAFTKAENGKIYVNVKAWYNEEPDQYGYHQTVMLNSTKEKAETEGKWYIGNLKKQVKKEPEPLKPGGNISVNIK